jgi:hypothetical protein
MRSMVVICKLVGKRARGGRGFKSHTICYYQSGKIRHWTKLVLESCWTIQIRCLESYFLGLLPDKNPFKAIMYLHITAYGKARR